MPNRKRKLPRKACKGCRQLFQPLNYRVQYCKRKSCVQARKKVRIRGDYPRSWELQRKYGITLEFWLAYLDASGHKCEICDKPDDAPGGVLCVDHDHETGKFRGALCRACNRSIGQLGDTAAHLRRALDYLEKVV